MKKIKEKVHDAKYDLLDPEPLYPGWGLLFQSDNLDQGITDLPAPLIIVNMTAEHIDEPWVNHISIQGVMSAVLLDTPEATLPDRVIAGFVEAVEGFLMRGVNVLVRCSHGKSRSSYLTVAVVMHILNMDYDSSLNYVRQEHPEAQPNPGFEAQLRRIEPILRMKL